jgi:hypothetical protein
MRNSRSLYLQVGDHVYHARYAQWGIGTVVEEWNSTLPEGRCFVKVKFQDKRTRIFDNDFTSLLCCYYSGLRQMDAGD